MRKPKKLTPSQAERIKEKFPEHPLYQACQAAFRHFMAEMHSFDFTSEDLFVAAAYVIDDIAEEPLDAPDYIDGLWDDLKIELKRLSKSAPPQEDLNTVCSVLLCVVAATLRLQWNEHYNETIVGRLHDVIRMNGTPIYEKDLDDTINRICEHADALDKWINDYTSYSIDWLSQTIDAVIVSCGKVIPLNDDKTFVESPATFRKCGTLVDANLTLLYQQLQKKKWIAQDTTPDEFIELFSGRSSYVKIYWMRSAGALRDLFKSIIDEGLIVCPDGIGYQRILSSHFVTPDGKYILNLNKTYKGKKIAVEIAELMKLLKTVVSGKDVEDV